MLVTTAQLRLRAMFSHFQPFFSTVSSESPLKVIDVPWAHFIRHPFSLNSDGIISASS